MSGMGGGGADAAHTPVDTRKKPSNISAGNTNFLIPVTPFLFHVLISHGHKPINSSLKREDLLFHGREYFAPANQVKQSGISLENNMNTINEANFTNSFLNFHLFSYAI
jgi:hypothetical protein